MSAVKGQSPRPEFVELDKLWRAAEEAIKTAEHLGGEPPVAPINELRYSGRHLLDAVLEVEDAERRKGDLHKARRHAFRAKYDAAEAHILHCARALIRFKEDYRKTPIQPVLDDYLEILAFSRKVQARIGANRTDSGPTFVGESRAQDRSEKRDADHELFIEYAEQYSDYIAKIDVAREELNKLVAKQRASTRRWVLGFAVSLVGLAVTLIVANC